MQLETRLNEIDKVTESFLNTFGSLTHQQLNWKPAADQWSIGQNIDHLIVINSTYFTVIDEIRNNRYTLPWTARFGFLVRFFGKLILSAVQPDRKRKGKTFPVWEPSSSDISAHIMEQFVHHQHALKRTIADSADLVMKGVVISSPANRYIVYKLADAFDIIIAHERRHYEQAKEVLTSAGFPR